MHYAEMLWWMLVGHAVCDYPLQGDFLSRAKNHKAPVPGVPWWIALWAHAIIHGGMVAAVMHDIRLGVCEVLAHAAIDHAKCDGEFGFELDQLLHVLCKVAWLAGAAAMALYAATVTP